MRTTHRFHHTFTVDKSDLVICLALLAVVYTYIAAVEAKKARRAAERDLDPITVEPAGDEEADSEDSDE